MSYHRGIILIRLLVTDMHYQQTLKARNIFLRTHVLTQPDSYHILPSMHSSYEASGSDFFFFFTNASYHPPRHRFFPFFSSPFLSFTALHLPPPTPSFPFLRCPIMFPLHISFGRHQLSASADRQKHSAGVTGGRGARCAHHLFPP
jgi:hypothetical protein